MIKMQLGLIVALLLLLPSEPQVRSGSLVVWIVSQRSDYVVIGAESRNVDGSGRFIDDRACKIISLGGDTLFYETGNAVIGVYRGVPWSSNGAARSIYRSSQKHDAISLCGAWGIKALRWLYTQPEIDLRATAEPPHGNVFFGGFINFDKNGVLSVQSVDISYHEANRTLTAQPSTQAPGQVGTSGVGLDLVEEFFVGKTNRAIRAFGPVGMVRLIGANPSIDTNNIKNVFRFVMTNATEKDKAFLGGDIDIAVIRNNRTIEWISRKSRCYQQDENVAHSPRDK